MRSPVQIRIAAPKSLENFGFQGFFVANFDFLVWVKMWASWLTHTVTHTPKGPERFKECRAGSLRFPPGFFLSVLHDLLHKAAHGGCCLVLLLPCCVGIGAEGEPGIVVPQHGGHRLYIHTVLKGCGGEGVPLRYNYDKPEKPRRIKGFEVFSLIFSSFSKPKNHTEISRIAGGVSLTTNE